MNSAPQKMGKVLYGAIKTSENAHFNNEVCESKISKHGIGCTHVYQI